MPLDAATQKTVDKLLSNNASADHPEIKDALAQMEVQLKEKLGTSHLLYKDHQQLRRFLVARKLKLDETMEMINNHMEWRARMLPVTLTEEVKAELKRARWRSTARTSRVGRCSSSILAASIQRSATSIRRSPRASI